MLSTKAPRLVGQRCLGTSEHGCNLGHASVGADWIVCRESDPPLLNAIYLALDGAVHDAHQAISRLAVDVGCLFMYRS